MVSTSKTIVISGYYGFKNSGDEAVLKSILTALAEESEATGVTINPVVLSIDPEWTSAVYGVKSVHRMRLGEVRQAIKESDGLISGGGSLLQDATSPKTIPYYLGVLKLAQWLGKPTFIYAQGVGPVNRKFFYPMIRSVFRQCSYISVRDTQSGQLLQSMGISPQDIQVVPDPVMGLPLTSAASDGAVESASIPVLGISVRYWNAERTELKAIAKALQELVKRRAVHLRFLPFYQPDDLEASRFIADHVGDVSSSGSVISYYLDEKQPEDMLRAVSECDLILGMRLHSLIYAANQEVPLLGISYDPKIDHFLKRLGSEPVGSSTSLDATALLRQMERLLDSKDEWIDDHSEQIAVLKQEAVMPARHIAEFLRDRG
ncbi:polysaccharide pyruvyl transferase CsaB [Paenibacillus sp. JCM 10914]|uniref:polysaccharide pyruvyl transferase CsaB n=1 Tax=Paenibacillus sp. JCM 10914 TaxID=1236974 RepID=UPI0003CC8D7B|nr:polysaccharide pyruvyl transferase CsaB [Paenibacillus sp. JCM 10914]GAE09837.1 CsaB protein [Paenibacillus sp. JCM 10914]